MKHFLVFFNMKFFNFINFMVVNIISFIAVFATKYLINIQWTNIIFQNLLYAAKPLVANVAHFWPISFLVLA